MSVKYNMNAIVKSSLTFLNVSPLMPTLSSITEYTIITVATDSPRDRKNTDHRISL